MFPVEIHYVTIKPNAVEIASAVCLSAARRPSICISETCAFLTNLATEGRFDRVSPCLVVFLPGLVTLIVIRLQVSVPWFGRRSISCLQPGKGILTLAASRTQAGGCLNVFMC